MNEALLNDLLYEFRQGNDTVKDALERNSAKMDEILAKIEHQREEVRRDSALTGGLASALVSVTLTYAQLTLGVPR